MDDEINLLIFVKGEDKYIFLFEDDQANQVLRTLGKFASNPELNLNWYDAAVLSKRVREITRE